VHPEGANPIIAVVAKVDAGGHILIPGVMPGQYYVRLEPDRFWGNRQELDVVVAAGQTSTAVVLMTN